MSARRIVLASIGRFHYGTLASELWSRGRLEAFYSAFFRSRLRCHDVPADRLRTWPWVQTPLTIAERSGLFPDRLIQAWMHLAHRTLDRHIARVLPDCDVYAALAGCAVESGAIAKRRGMRVVCERSSPHIRWDEETMERECARWDLPFKRLNPALVDRDEQEYAQADRIIVVSEHSRGTFLERGFDPDRLRVVAPDIDLPSFGSPCGTARERRPCKGLRILFVGQMGVRKGLHVLLHAHKRAELGGSEIVCAGASGRVTRTILSRFPDAPVRNLGHLSHPSLVEQFQAADLTVVPSVSDGLPLVVYEALAHGCPVVVSDACGASEAVIDDVNGLVFPSGDVEALATILRRFVDEPELAERLRAGVERAGATWNVDGAYADRWIEAIQ
ncbi:MAG: glycosyltransferase [Gammaproteobacteria bacterium]